MTVYLYCSFKGIMVWLKESCSKLLDGIIGAILNINDDIAFYFNKNICFVQYFMVFWFLYKYLFYDNQIVTPLNAGTMDWSLLSWLSWLSWNLIKSITHIYNVEQSDEMLIHLNANQSLAKALFYTINLPHFSFSVF